MVLVSSHAALITAAGSAATFAQRLVTPEVSPEEVNSAAVCSLLVIDSSFPSSLLAPLSSICLSSFVLISADLRQIVLEAVLESSTSNTLLIS